MGKDKERLDEGAALIIEVIGNGTTDPPPGRRSRGEGGAMTVTALPGEGYTFYQWELDGKRSGRMTPVIRIGAGEGHVLRALFVKDSLLAPIRSADRPGSP